MQEAIISGMDAIMPLKEKSISVNEAPWMNNSLKRVRDKSLKVCRSFRSSYY